MEVLPAVTLGLVVMLLDPPVVAFDAPPVMLPVLLVWLPELLDPPVVAFDDPAVVAFDAPPVMLPVLLVWLPELELVPLLLPDVAFPLVLLPAICPEAKLANGVTNTSEKTRTAATAATIATLLPRWRVLCPSSMCDTPIHVIYDVRKATRLEFNRQGVPSLFTRG